MHWGGCPNNPHTHPNHAVGQAVTKEETVLGCLGMHRGTQAALAAADGASDPSIFSSYRNMFVFAC